MERQFEKFAMYCESKLAYIPLTFMLGFFVTIVVDRWRSIFQNMGWIENLALTVSALLRGDSKEAILYRRSIIRYTVLGQVSLLESSSKKYVPCFSTILQGTWGTLEEGSCLAARVGQGCVSPRK
ncbi:hypothetical protein COOONC_18380 [Cooperia oncophora]